MSSKLSKHRQRLQLEKSPLKSIGAVDFKPGDQVLIKIPHKAGETERVWAYVMASKKKAGEIIVCIDDVAVVNRNLKFQPGAVTSVSVNSVLRYIPAGNDKPLLQIALIDGTLQEMLRVDGKTTPIRVNVDEDHQGKTYLVDHRSFDAQEQSE
jgi:hypothetical protein